VSIRPPFPQRNNPHPAAPDSRNPKPAQPPSHAANTPVSRLLQLRNHRTGARRRSRIWDHSRSARARLGSQPRATLLPARRTQVVLTLRVKERVWRGCSECEVSAVCARYRGEDEEFVCWAAARHTTVCVGREGGGGSVLSGTPSLGDLFYHNSTTALYSHEDREVSGWNISPVLINMTNFTDPSINDSNRPYDISETLECQIRINLLMQLQKGDGARDYARIFGRDVSYYHTRRSLISSR